MGLLRWEVLAVKSTVRSLLAFPLQNSQLFSAAYAWFLRAIAHALSPLYTSRLSRMLQDLPPVRPITARKHFKIVMVISTLGPGGAERQCVALANALSDEAPHSHGRLDVTIVLCDGETESANFFVNDLNPSVEIIYLSQHINSVKSKQCMQDVLFLNMTTASRYRALYEVLLRLQPDVIHGWLDESSLMGALAGLRLGVPTILLSTRSLRPTVYPGHKTWFRSAFREVAKYPNVHIVNNSRRGARDYEDWLSLGRGTICTVDNGYNFLESTSNAGPNQSSAKVGVTVGGVLRLSTEKDPILWLRTAAVLHDRHPDWKFVLIGDGPRRGQVRRFSARSGLAECFTHILKSNRVQDYFTQMDVLLLTSRVEGLPNVLIEAQAASVPVVSTDVGGASECFLDGASGSLVKSRDCHDIATAIEHVICLNQKSGNLGQRGRAYVIERFSMKRTLEQHLHLYGII